jgi:FkbM family methyltransferase
MNKKVSKPAELDHIDFVVSCPVPRQGGNHNFYAQFYEDYILSIALSHIEKGYYVDVGSNSPDLDSVTKCFYQKGWRGINIEPIKKWHDLYLIERPEDININKGVSNVEGKIDFYVSSVDLMSSGNIDFVDKAKKKGYEFTKQIIEVTTLSRILEQHPLPSITFMKIDVEGMESQILNGLNFSKYRPMVLIIESIRPFSHARVQDDWELVVLNNNYTFVFFDSLNRYYIADEHFDKMQSKFDKAVTCYSLLDEKYPEYKIQNVFKHELDY